MEELGSVPSVEVEVPFGERCPWAARAASPDLRPCRRSGSQVISFDCLTGGIAVSDLRPVCVCVCVCVFVCVCLCVCCVCECMLCVLCVCSWLMRVRVSGARCPGLC